MTTTFTVTLKIKVTHDKDTHIDENSVKGFIGGLIADKADAAVEQLCEVGDKTEGNPEAVKITLVGLKEGLANVIDIKDFADYLV